MTELSAEFEKYLTEAYSARPSKVLCSLLQAAYLAGAAVGAKRERERCVEIASNAPLTIFHIDGQVTMRKRIAQSIRREGEGC